MSDETPFREWCWGADAARVFGVADAASVWRAVSRHRTDYPGEIEIVRIGNRKVVRRDQLVAFTTWFAAGPGARDTRIRIGVDEPAEAEQPPAPEMERAAVTDARRAKLARQIARLTGVQ